MKKVFLAVLSGLVVIVFYLLPSPQFAAEREALGSVGNTLVTAPYHQAVILEGGGRAGGQVRDTGLWTDGPHENGRTS